MKNILLNLLIFIPVLSFAQLKNHIPKFMYSPPFHGMKGNIKSYILKAFDGRIDLNKDTILYNEDPKHIESHFFNKAGLVDSTFIVFSSNKIHKTYYKGHIPYKSKDGYITDSDTIIMSFSEYEYTWLDRNRGIQKIKIIPADTKEIEIKQDTVWIDNKKQSIKYSPFSKNNFTVFYQNRQILKTVNEYEDGTISSVESFYKNGLLDRKKYYTNNKLYSEEKSTYTKYDRYGNWTEQYITRDADRVFTVCERKIIYRSN